MDHLWWFEESLMDIDPHKLRFRHNGQVASLYLGQSIQTDAYFFENPNSGNIPTKRQIIHLGGHASGLRCSYWP
jgi:hypothetical protein